LSRKVAKVPTRGRDTVPFLLCFSKEVKQKIKQEALRMFGKRKGAESMYVEMVLRAHFKMNIEGVEET